VERKADRSTPGWERIEFRCWHRLPGLVRGEPAVLDYLEAEAHANPCKLINCPQRARSKEEP
jgi:hypothetical protein